MQSIIHVFLHAFRDARSNLLHTILSVLGIVIGVAALVGILSLIDGMEMFAREQIEKTTSLNSIQINSKTTERINGVLIRKQEVPVLEYANLSGLNSALKNPHQTYLRYQESGWLHGFDSAFTLGVLLSGINEEPHEQFTINEGTGFSQEMMTSMSKSAVINQFVADRIDSLTSGKFALGMPVVYHSDTFRIIGISETVAPRPEIFVPITVIPLEKLAERPPTCLVNASTVEDVPALRAAVEEWLHQQFPNTPDGFRVSTNEFRVKQANQSFLIFRIVMGLIVGLSVIVGGIGVMNVLLISVTERTREIGVKKAMGAKRRDIIFQFLAESLTVSAIGSILGVILGVLFTAAAIPVIRKVTEMPFQTVYTWNTFLIIAVVSILIGIIFGTYPAIKASRLDPVDAIRHE
ncbi:ABC transporter permease [Fulvivirga sedimenti]|uniref:ABC transporter permease n=1 Tax=Fulvivirga sedimenti TaxID=2879465 RepID=A0A9X1HQA6_9BACT|nr:ABC transporter permease [Fulvivirga sedimenti]MCA6074257.1 ABC transporter permease [Fulvivirga sedimenti]